MSLYMNREAVLSRMRLLLAEPAPLPGGGDTPRRHEMLMNIGREDLSLARLAEAHFDAVAILAEAGRRPQPGAIYAVWASEIPGHSMTLERKGNSFLLRGEKMFCSGAGLVDRALITVPMPDHRLVDLDLRNAASKLRFDDSVWKTSAFSEIQTSTILVDGVNCATTDVVGEARWYLERPGFWHGACGPAACWAGGAQGVADYAMQQARVDAHTLAHLGAMHASVWAMKSALASAAHEIDDNPLDISQARVRARILRHLVEVMSTDILRRLARAYGPHPLAMDESISRRYQELDLYLRQSHAERDLEALGRDLNGSYTANSKSP
jgi:alkylation response protein AidB-like acyl-CoA dehydrogenase